MKCREEDCCPAHADALTFYSGVKFITVYSNSSVKILERNE